MSSKETYVEAYPLHWPDGWPRAKYPEKSNFKTKFAKARDNLVRELRLMGAKYAVVSTNVPLKRDGLPYANFKALKDKGVAVYFEYKRKSMTFACDRWDSVTDNVQAIRKTIEALRDIERWGASDMMEKAFSGFEALPPPVGDEWWSVLEVKPSDSKSIIKDAYREKVKMFHPDNGICPDVEMMKGVNLALAEAEKAV